MLSQKLFWFWTEHICYGQSKGVALHPRCEDSAMYFLPALYFLPVYFDFPLAFIEFVLTQFFKKHDLWKNRRGRMFIS